MPQGTEAAAIIPGDDIALFVLFGQNCAGSNFVGGKSLSTAPEPASAWEMHRCCGGVSFCRNILFS
ncbi:hypothetical protein [Methanogenium cariaci]|uniref:hypothetical protein n=1 Tax=Methanogenium cariaci TaxID=2197 RepID=UPI000786550E|nr:hypothetical protein [Methanogenium cariaci]